MIFPFPITTINMAILDVCVCEPCFSFVLFFFLSSKAVWKSSSLKSVSPASPLQREPHSHVTYFPVCFFVWWRHAIRGVACIGLPLFGPITVVCESPPFFLQRSSPNFSFSFLPEFYLSDFSFIENSGLFFIPVGTVWNKWNQVTWSKLVAVNAGKGSVEFQSAITPRATPFFFPFLHSYLNEVGSMGFTCDSFRCVCVCVFIIYAASHSRCE
jgi:hypothetical protein